MAMEVLSIKKYNDKQTQRYLDHMSKFTTVVEVA
jgi:hypothetical protein